MDPLVAFSDNWVVVFEWTESCGGANDGGIIVEVPLDGYVGANIDSKL